MRVWSQIASAILRDGTRARLARALVVLLLIGSTAAAVALQANAAGRARDAAALHRPFEIRADGYVSSDACRSCHPTQYASWASSYHRRMTQLATPESVIGSFEHVALGQDSQYRLERQGDAFFVDIVGEQRYPITLLTGSHHMQIYWYETGNTRLLGQLPFAYLKADRRWVPRNAIFIEPPLVRSRDACNLPRDALRRKSCPDRLWTTSCSWS